MIEIISRMFNKRFNRDLEKLRVKIKEKYPEIDVRVYVFKETNKNHSLCGMYQALPFCVFKKEPEATIEYFNGLDLYDQEQYRNISTHSDECKKACDIVSDCYTFLRNKKYKKRCPFII